MLFRSLCPKMKPNGDFPAQTAEAEVSQARVLVWLETLKHLVAEFNDREPTLDLRSSGSCIGAVLNEHEEMIERIKRKDGL